MSIRITYEIDGRIVELSPRYSVPVAALALNYVRANFPRPGQYRVWSIKDHGARAVCIGNMPACYPAGNDPRNYAALAVAPQGPAEIPVPSFTN